MRLPAGEVLCKANELNYLCFLIYNVGSDCKIKQISINLQMYNSELFLVVCK